MRNAVLSCLVLLLTFPGAYAAGDAGVAWKVIHPSYPPASGLKAVEKLQSGAFLVFPERGSFKTADQGKTWTFIDTKLDDETRGSFFLNSTKGWLWSSREIVVTNDGGSSWTKLSPSPWSRDYGIRRALFLDDRTGFLLTGYGNIVRTEDGGAHWEKIPSLPKTLGNHHKFFFTDPVRGLATAGPDVYRTDDRGATWKKIHHGETKVHAACVNGRNGVIIEEFGDTYYTSDGGSTWKEGEIKPYESLVDIEFTADCNAAGISGQGAVYRTTDRGRTWSIRNLKQTGQKQRMREMLLTAGDNLVTYAVLGYKSIFQTADGGESWSETPLPANSQSWARGRMIIVAQYPNTIGFSDDLGATWKKIVSANENVLDAVMVDGGTGYAVTNNGAILKTTSGGNAWDPIAELYVYDESSISHARIDFMNEQSGSLLLNRRIFYATSDGGKTWKLVFDLNDARYAEIRKNMPWAMNELFLSQNNPEEFILRGLNGLLATGSIKTKQINGVVRKPLDKECPRWGAILWDDPLRGWSISSDDPAARNHTSSWSFWRIENGGRSCRKISDLPALGNIRGLSVNGKDLVVVSDESPAEPRATILISEDGGVSWSAKPLDNRMSRILRADVQVKDRTVRVLDDSNRFWISRNRGETWTETVITGYKPNKPVIMHSGMRWTTNDWITEDAGKSWQRAPTICNRDRFSMLHWNANVSADALSRRFCKNRDSLPQYRSFRAFAFPRRIILVEDDGQVHHMDDSGAVVKAGVMFSMPVSSDRPERQIGSISFIDEDHGCAYGMFAIKERVLANGLFCTNDGGKSWRQSRIEKADDEMLGLVRKEELPSDDAMAAKALGLLSNFKGVFKAVFQLTDAQHGWGVVTTFAKKVHLIRTKDGGFHWKHVAELAFAQEPDNKEMLNEYSFVRFADERRGYIGGRSFLFSTDDGGRTFRKDAFPQRVGSNYQLVIDHGKAFLVTDKAILEYIGAAGSDQATRLIFKEYHPKSRCF